MFMAADKERMWDALSRILTGYVSCIDRQRRVLFLNRTLSRDLSEVLGQPMESFVAPPHRDAVIACAEQAFVTGQEQRLEYTVVLGDDSRRYIATRVLPFAGADGQPLALMLTEDFTDRQRLERALEQSVEFRRRVVEHLPDFVSLIDGDRRLVWTNRLAPGLTADDVIGAKIDKFISPETRAAAESVIAAAFANGESGQFEVEGYSDGQGSAWYLTRVAPVFSGGKIEHVLLLVADVTERKRAELSLREAEERLHQAQRMESIGQLAGGIAHDFNNLLQIIAGNLYCALEGVAAGRTAKEELEQALRATTRASELTSHLLAIGRRQRMDAKPVDLGLLVASSLRMLRRAIPENVELSYVEPAQSVFAKVDSAQFEQVLINLCVNARDAMASGGRLTVRLEPHDGARVILTVEDDGAGIPPESLPRIFEPFFSTKGAGSGLGLAVAAGIVGAHGGTITVESDGRSGTRVKVTLPRVEPAAPVPSPVQTAVKSDTKGVILLAEVDPLVREQLVRMLESEGHTVYQAENGARAVAIFEERPGAIDLLLLDAIMPVLDGWKTFQRISEIRPGIRVIFATGYAAEVLPEDLATTGARLLSKPFTPAALLAEVRLALATATKQAASA